MFITLPIIGRCNYCVTPSLVAKARKAKRKMGEIPTPNFLLRALNTFRSSGFIRTVIVGSGFLAMRVTVRQST